MELLKNHLRNIDVNEKIKAHHLFVLLTSFYILFSSISSFSGFLALFSAIFFYMSYIVGERLYYILNLDDISNCASIFNLKKPYRPNYPKHYKFGLFLMFIGILFIFFDILWVKDIPLFDPTSRRFLNVPFTALSHLLLLGWAIAAASNLSLNKIKVIVYSIVFSALIMLLGYRTNVMILFLSILFVMYYSNKIKTKELIYSTFGIFLILLSMSILRLYVLGSGGNPIFSRIDLTMSIFDIIVKNFNGVFNGLIHYCSIYSYIGTFPGPRTVVANSIGVYGVTITPTIFGAVIGDYGTLGIIPYFGILGIFLGLFYKISESLKGIYLGVYAILISYLLVGIETGILDFDVILFYIFGFILCIYIILLKILNKLKKLKRE
ncbi:oligosaccharide repeat unit polymerase family protein [Methanothermococcus sp. Ax23]|uniref:oligosaccharide repeat unit polymerase family protein n=1 Tax=Methanothermococcus sp. Ax23 TaxID=3156486 RepID=UPI003BA2E261